MLFLIFEGYLAWRNGPSPAFLNHATCMQVDATVREHRKRWREAVEKEFRRVDTSCDVSMEAHCLFVLKQT